jgi:flagellin
MAQNIQVIKAASNGITGLTALVNQAKAVAQTAQSQASGGALATGLTSFTPAAQANIVGTNGIAAADSVVVTKRSAADAQVGPSTTILIPAAMTLQALVDQFNSISGVSATLVADPNNAGNVFLQLRTTDGLGIRLTDAAGGLTGDLFGASIATGVTEAATTVAPTDLTALQSQYDGLRTQMDQFITDTGYSGKNLLNGDSMTTQFNTANTSTLTTNGNKRDAAGLGIAAADFDTTADITTALAQITDALNRLQVDGVQYGNDLAVIQARADFTNAQIGTLRDGANQLTVVDKNSAGAELLALQTQQQLGIQSLSLASQANQSVLRLFQ